MINLMMVDFNQKVFLCQDKVLDPGNVVILYNLLICWLKVVSYVCYLQQMSFVLHNCFTVIYFKAI